MMINSPLSTDDSYTFAILADPQLSGNSTVYTGDWNNHRLINYQQYYKTIEEINRIQPTFVLINGDLVGDPTNDAQYQNFINLTKLIEVPVLLSAGNHDIPPYGGFLQAQQEISGFQSLYYSFDVGQWHYVVLPSAKADYDADPMLQWLAADMEANKERNTMVFSHYHVMPQGLTQLEFYRQKPLELENQIMDEVLRHGNTKYWYSGHVHNGIQTSVKTAWEYRGAKFIVSPTIVTPRGFGEEYPSFEEGLTKGGYFMTVDVNEATALLKAHRTEQEDVLVYPDQFPTFSSSVDPRWFERVSDFAPQSFSNGSFESGLEGWSKVWRYKTDEKPGFVTRTSLKYSTEGSRSLVTQVRDKGRTKWKSDELTEVYQVVEAQDGLFPVLSLDYYIDKLSSAGGGYIRVHAYDAASHHSTMVFHFNEGATQDTTKNTRRVFNLTAAGQPSTLASAKGLPKKKMHWDLSKTLDTWHHLEVDLKALYEEVAESTGSSSTFEPDKFFIGLGTWNANQDRSVTRVFFDNVDIQWLSEPSLSTNDGQALSVTSGIFESVFINSDTEEPAPSNSDATIQESDRSVALVSSSHHDRLLGGRHADVLRGKLGNDVLLGRGGDDKLVGGQGSDTFNGYGQPQDFDRLAGKGGRDTFVLGNQTNAFYLGSGDCIIKDFSRHEADKIQLHGSSDQYNLHYGYFGSDDAIATQISFGQDKLGIVRGHRVSLEKDVVFL